MSTKLVSAEEMIKILIQNNKKLEDDLEGSNQVIEGYKQVTKEFTVIIEDLFSNLADVIADLTKAQEKLKKLTKS